MSNPRSLSTIEAETGVTFSAARAEWVAAGRPSTGLVYCDRFLNVEVAPAPIVPLVAGITSEMVAAASGFNFPERSHWPVG